MADLGAEWDATPAAELADEWDATPAPKASPANPAQAAADELGPVEGAVVAFGENARHLLRQGGNYVSKIPGVRALSRAIGMEDATDEQLREESRNLAPLRRRFPVASALGSASLAVPTAVGAASTLLPASLTVPQMAVGSALLTGAQAEAFSDPEERIPSRNAGLSLGASMPLGLGAASNVAGRILSRGAAPSGVVLPAPPRPVKGAVPEARAMMREGVPLTPGQQNPTGAWNQIEEASTSVPGVGPATARIRAANQEKWAESMLRRGTAPGQQPPASGDPGEMTAELRAGFKRAYDAVKGEITRYGPTQLASGFSEAATNPTIMASDAGRKEAARFLDNQLSLLKGGAPTVEKLLTIRSNIREAGRAAFGTETAPILKQAEAKVTEALMNGADPAVAKQLAEIDRQYATFKTLSRAVRNAGDLPMTPSHLSNAVKARTPEQVYAEGGGILRDEARAGKAIFDSRSNPTGQRLLTIASSVPGVRFVPATAAYLRASHAAKAGAPISVPATTADTGLQHLAAELGVPVQKAEELISTLRLRLAPAAGDQDRSQESGSPGR